MQALLFHQHGDLDNVSVGDVPRPDYGPDDVLIRVRSAALNRLDLWVLAGWRGLDLKLPHILGSDAAGDVAAVGDRVRGFAVGDRVAINPSVVRDADEFTRSGRDNLSPTLAIIGEHIDGGAAEFLVVPARNLLPLPDDVSYASAAAAALVYVTAWHSLITRGGLRPGRGCARRRRRRRGEHGLDPDRPPGGRAPHLRRRLQ